MPLEPASVNATTVMLSGPNGVAVNATISLDATGQVIRIDMVKSSSCRLRRSSRSDPRCSRQWTDQDGGGRPLSKGTGRAVADPARPLKGSRAFNRISGLDANSCQGCHNAPYGITGGGGDFVTSGFEQADRFDFMTFEPGDTQATRGALDESKQAVSLQTVGHARATPGLFGAGYLEMLARQMTDDLQRIRDALAPGESRPLVSKGIAFGTLARHADRRWDVSKVQGLSESSVAIPSGRSKPSLIVDEHDRRRDWPPRPRIGSE